MRLHLAMNSLCSNLLRLATSHQEAVGWSSSAVLHFLGAALASATFATLGMQPPELIGQQTAAEIELLAAWSQPPAPAVEISPSEPHVVVQPKKVSVAQQTYLRTSTDVSRPTPTEIAMVDSLLAPPPVVEPRACDTMPAHGAPPQRHTCREAPQADVSVAGVSSPASAPQLVSIGTSDRAAPRLLSNRPPTYPEEAIIRGLEGTVLLRLYITSEGQVGKLEIVSSSGHAILDAAAVGAVRSWRFMPAFQAGRSMAAAVRLPVRFSLD